MADRFLSERFSKRAFTLVELLVVIAVIGVLIALLLPAIQSSRDAARRTACASNMRQIGLAVQTYLMAKEAYPRSTDKDLDIHWRSLEQHSWASLILPYMEQTTLYESIDFTQDLEHPHNLAPAATVVSTYRCPAYAGPDHSERFLEWTDKEYAIGNYVALSTIDVDQMWQSRIKPTGVIYPLSAVEPQNITDGLSHTVLIAESREDEFRVWMDGLYAGYTAMRRDAFSYPRGRRISLNRTPYYGYYATYGPSSEHPGGAYHLFGDGAVRFVQDDVYLEIYTSYTTRKGENLSDYVVWDR